jgi:hypothetical protein
MSKTTCLVKNRGASHVSYRIPEDGIRRSFAPGETKEISYQELEKLTFQPGGMMILTNYLQIIEQEALNTFGIRTEPEYHMSEADIAKLIKVGTLDAFLDALDFAPVSVIDLIKKMSVDIPLMDMEKRKALKAKTGFDVDAALRHIEEEKEDNGQNTILKTTERRVKPDAAPAGRRTAPPQYNIIKKAEEAPAETAE